MKEQETAAVTGKGFLARMYWVFLGNGILFFVLVFIVEKAQPFPSVLDVVYWVALVSLIGVRYVDIQFLGGQDGAGAPATMTHWRRYSGLVALAGGGAWILARLAGHLLH